MGIKDQGLTVSTNRHRVIPRTLIFIFRDEKVLLIRGAPDKKIWPNKYNGVGGHVESNESVLESAYRELYEETGLTRDQLQGFVLKGIINIDTKDEGRGIILFVFTGICTTEIIKDSSEGTSCWVNWRHLNENDLVEDLPSLLTFMEEKTGSALFYGRYFYSDQDQLKIEFKVEE